MECGDGIWLCRVNFPHVVISCQLCSSERDGHSVCTHTLPLCHRPLHRHCFVLRSVCLMSNSMDLQWGAFSTSSFIHTIESRTIGIFFCVLIFHSLFHKHDHTPPTQPSKKRKTSPTRPSPSTGASEQGHSAEAAPPVVRHPRTPTPDHHPFGDMIFQILPTPQPPICPYYILPCLPLSISISLSLPPSHCLLLDISALIVTAQHLRGTSEIERCAQQTPSPGEIEIVYLHIWCVGIFRIEVLGEHKTTTLAVAPR